MSYVMKRLLPEPDFGAAVERVRAALQAEGFGIPTEMDTRALFQQKLQKDSPARVILGACLAKVAFEALQADPDLAALVPCNVVVRRLDEGCEVTAVRPSALFALSGTADPGFAEAVEGKLKAALGRL